MSTPQPRQTDVRRRTVLPTTLQSTIANQSTSSSPDITSEEYLSKIEEEFNKKLDGDVESLVEGMGDLVRLQKLEGKDHFKATQDSFQTSIRTESMIKAAHSLLSISHSLKLLHLFNDLQTPLLTRERLAQEYQVEIDRLRAEVGI